VIKLSIVLVLLALLAWFLYRWLRPYLQLLGRILNALRGALDPAAQAGQFEAGQDPQLAKSKLVRCAECNTWIPMVRAFNANSKVYCSRECLKHAPAERSRKTAS